MSIPCCHTITQANSVADIFDGKYQPPYFKELSVRLRARLRHEQFNCLFLNCFSF